MNADLTTRITAIAGPAVAQAISHEFGGTFIYIPTPQELCAQSASDLAGQQRRHEEAAALRSALDKLCFDTVGAA